MDNKEIVMKLVYSIINFLKSELEGSSRLTEEGNESVEVAVQCLENAYGISPESTHLSTTESLYEIFSRSLTNDGNIGINNSISTPSEEDKRAAESLKNEGNQLMREEKFTQALDCYTKAIIKDGTNAVYYSNRAAAHSKLNNHMEAIEDCRRALRIEPMYSKAYGRMGLAYSALDKAKEARECYQKALEVEPDNESYQSNLLVAEEKLRTAQVDQEQQQSSYVPPNNANPFSAASGGGGGFGFGPFGGIAAGLAGGGGGMPDIQSLISNPAMMNMATQLMSDPSMQNMLASFLGSPSGSSSEPSSNPSAPSSAESTRGTSGQATSGVSGMEALITAGRQLAEQIQSQHPDLIDQMRNRMGNNQQNGSNPPS